MNTEYTRQECETLANMVKSEQREDSHLNHPDSDAVKAYWKSKVGRCLGCDSGIAVDESYCPACESFLIEAHKNTCQP